MCETIISIFLNSVMDFTVTQVPNILSMPTKWPQVFYYVFLVVPSLDFMLEVKSSQKLIVPSVPFIENASGHEQLGRGRLGDRKQDW